MHDRLDSQHTGWQNGMDTEGEDMKVEIPQDTMDRVYRINQLIAQRNRYGWHWEPGGTSDRANSRSIRIEAEQVAKTITRLAREAEREGRD